MTLEELYREIGGSYEQAQRVLRIDRLIDKHIRKFAESDVMSELLAQRTAPDGAKIFESAHAVKGICANLGLAAIAALASELTEEFRPGNPRKLTDAEVAERIGETEDLYRRAVAGIRRYADSAE